MNERQLINHVRNHVQLYDFNHPKYNDSLMNKKIWRTISAELKLPGIMVNFKYLKIYAVQNVQ